MRPECVDAASFFVTDIVWTDWLGTDAWKLGFACEINHLLEDLLMRAAEQAVDRYMLEGLRHSELANSVLADARKCFARVAEKGWLEYRNGALELTDLGVLGCAQALESGLLP